MTIDSKIDEEIVIFCTMIDEEDFEWNGFMANPFKPLGQSSETTIQAMRTSESAKFRGTG